MAASEPLLLFCVAHAGGSAAAWSGWATALKPNVEIIPLELAGRGSRTAEVSRYETLQAVADDLTERAVSIATSRTFAVLGHSMGGVVAYEMARLCQAQSVQSLAALIFLGTPPPGRPATGRKISDLEDEVFLRALSALGGIPGDVVTDPDLRDHFAPVLRNDYRLFENYEADVDAAALPHPALVMTASLDPVNEPDDSRRWRELMRGTLLERIVPGAGHFFAATHGAEVQRVVGGFLGGQVAQGR